ncbi:MAG: hypothetical protein ACP5HP_02955 [Thermogladius sp.]
MAEFGEKTASAYLSIHLVPCDAKSECPFYKLEKAEEDQCVAVCTVTDRVLTRSSARKCLTLWRECPFYKLGVESSGS